MCESMGHRPLQGWCPAPSLNFKHNLLKQGTRTADHPTLLRLFFLNSLSPEIQFGYSQWRGLRHHALLFSENKATQLQFHDWNTRNSCPWTWQITCYSSFFLFFSISISFVSRFFPIFHEISYQANSNYLDF